MDGQTRMKQKIEDFSRFLITLLVLSIYFYLGLVIFTFIEPSDKSNILLILLITSVSLAGWFAFLLSKWRKQLHESLEQ
ncbi:YrhC family protein [Aquibacillus koreensis]|uniref:YrhC family protein n=1 Tax=Aquibacillus koreensis TaxID=279446 RepID=A0A9X3WIG0_9BACI|nr:YrhC family protein [Aquibacillus koreensis]MCT2537639.1 YrhC family protein [Aquibacillus koreensis]MDC3419085.1 YrhC family protein [Aquibacillus koreensis]